MEGRATLEHVRRALESRMRSVRGLSEALVARVREPIGFDQQRDIQILQIRLARLRHHLAWTGGRTHAP